MLCLILILGKAADCAFLVLHLVTHSQVDHFDQLLLHRVVDLSITGESPGAFRMT